MAENRVNKVLAVTVVVLAAVIVYVTWRALTYRDNVNVFLEKYTHVVDEFSQRDYYADANVPLRSDTTISNRVVFFGTQVVSKWDLAQAFPGYETINRGVPGQRLSGYVLRFLPDVVELGPAAVVIEISSYNFREESSIEELQDYVRLLVMLAQHHDIRPIVTTLIPHRRGFDVYESDYDVIDSIAVYAEWVTAYADSVGIVVVDFNGLLADEEGYLREDLSANTVEPNQAGYEKLAGAIRPVLDSLLK